MDPSEFGGRKGPAPLSGLAIASLVCAFFCQPVGLILGIIAMVKISGSRGAKGGMGLAIAGTVISAMMLVCCLPITAAIAIPGLLRSRIGSNETSAIGNLKAISTGQEMFKNALGVDQNENMVGEYGFLSELGGERKVRGASTVFDDAPYIPRILGMVDRDGVAQKNGYCFKIYLPSGPTGALEEGEAFPPADEEAADYQESAYVVYAWPVMAGRSGFRIFAVDVQGQIFSFANKGNQYSGPGQAPPWDAAFEDSNGNGKKDWGDSIGGSEWVPVG